MYELEQKLRQLERCECRINCRWTTTTTTTTTTATNRTQSGAAARSEQQTPTLTPRDDEPDRSADDKVKQQQQQQPPDRPGARPDETKLLVVTRRDGQVWQNNCNVCSCHVSRKAQREKPSGGPKTMDTSNGGPDYVPAANQFESPEGNASKLPSRPTGRPQAATDGFGVKVKLWNHLNH